MEKLKACKVTQDLVFNPIHGSPQRLKWTLDLSSDVSVVVFLKACKVAHFKDVWDKGL